MKNHTLIPGLCAGIIACVPFQPVQGQEAFEEMLVTGTRTPVPAAESLSSVTVISREELQALQPMDLIDVFRHVPGVDISRSGGPGSAASIFMRGTASDQTLLLLDGQRINSANLGSTSFEFLDPSQIQRIEVVRGPGSSLYGSDAIGGVIQIFTRENSGEDATHVSTGAGSNSLREASAGTSGAAGGFRYGVNLSHLETDGIDNHVDETGLNDDKDGYRNTSVTASLGYGFSGGADLSLRFMQSNSRNEYDDTFDPASKPYRDAWLQNVKAALELPVTDRWMSRLSLGRATDDSDNHDAVTGARDSHFRTQRDQLLWQNDVTITDGQLFTLGYEFYDDQVESSSSFEDAQGNPVSSRDNSAIFAQHQANFERISLTLGLRHDDNEEFGSESSGNIAFGYDLDQRHRVTLSWSQGFKAPTFNDLYWPASAFDAGNPDLVPETSENREAGLRGNYDTWYWQASYFENDIENLITWAPRSDGVFTPQNVDDAEITGGELLAGATLADWHIEGSVSYTSPLDAQQGMVLVNRVRRNAQLTIDRQINDWRLGLSFKAQSERYANSSNTVTLPGYGTMGARVSYRYNSRVTARLKVDNLLDKDYQLNQGYNQDGANWLLSLEYSL